MALKAGAVYPELVAAQWALESSYGKHFSGKWNAFGLKGAGTSLPTEEVIDGKRVTITAGFLDFASLKECVEYLVRLWYQDYTSEEGVVYKGTNKARSRGEAAQMLQDEGYATDPQYAEKLIKLMDEHEPLSGGELRGESHESKLVVEFVAQQDTALKKRPVQATELGEDERVVVGKGRRYGVVLLKELARDAHVWVELAHGAGSWFLWQPHWGPASSGGGQVVTPSAVNWDDFGALVTPHLTVGEVTQYDRRRKPKRGSADEARILKTAQEFEKIRVAWGSALGVTSFYRPAAINAEAGGVPNSKHITGEAMDIYPVKGSLDAFYQWIRVRWSGGLGDGRARGFIHLDTRNNGHFVPGAGVRPYVEWDY